MFLDQLRQMYIPGADLTVDEQLVATRCRCPFRQYIPSKPGKYGIKLFWICDSQTSYPLFGEIYLGRQPGNLAGAPNRTLDLVMRLAQRWTRAGLNITCDNYFTSAQLVEQLLALNTTLVGTIRKNKKEVPRELLPSRARPEFSSIFWHDRQLTLVSYVPKRSKAVILLSSMIYDQAVVDKNNRKPEIITYYNENKSGVDNLDHMVRLYTCKRKSKRWPLALFYNILDCTALSVFNVYRLKFPEYNQHLSH